MTLPPLAWLAKGRRAQMLALAAAVLLLFAGTAIGFYQEQSYRDQKLREIAVQGEIVASSVMAPLIFDDNRAAQEYLDALKANPEIEAAIVYRNSGARFAGFVRDGLRAPQSAPALKAPLFRDGGVVTVFPVRQKSEILGRIYLRAHTDSLERRVARYGGIILLIVMAALVLLVSATAQSALARANTRLREESAEREKAQEALRQAHKMEAMGQLSGGIAHDFNNLLMIMKGNLQLMERRLAQGNTDVAKYHAAAMEGVERAATLTRRILAFSRRQPLEPQSVDLSALIEGMLELLRHSAGPTVKLEIDLKAAWWTMCDANQMENIILNLAINARDAMPEGGTLAVRTRDAHLGAIRPMLSDAAPPGDYVELTLADTGAGMPADVREKAVDPFFTTKPLGQGTGLGLSMTFGYVRQSGGYLDIESAIGRGTTVRILMPRHAGEAPRSKDMP